MNRDEAKRRESSSWLCLPPLLFGGWPGHANKRQYRRVPHLQVCGQLLGQRLGGRLVEVVLQQEGKKAGVDGP